MKKRLIQLLSLALILIISLSVFAGCKGGKSKPNSDGSYDIESLTPVKVSQMKKQNDRSVIYYNGAPYLYYAMHLRIDHLRKTSDEELARLNYDTYAKQVKADGWDTVIVYISWSRIYDGEKYDFSDLEYQYSVAKKYDLKVHINWFGYDVCGFGGYMPWQEGDLEKYPCLSGMDGSPLLSANNEYIPDFSQQIFLDESYDAIQQVCAWLNVNDTDRRTVAIQLENEPGNTEGGNGLWMSQFTNMANHLNNLGKAVKESPYSMVTYLNLMSAGFSEETEGYDIKGRIHHLIDKEYIDIVGWDLYTNDTAPRYKNIEYGNNLPLFAEMGICAYSVPGQINYSFSNGYGLGFYMFVNVPDTTHNNGFYRYNNVITGLEKRDGTQIIPENPIDTMGGKEELKTEEVLNINKSVKAIRELIATQKINNIAAFNNSMKNVAKTLKLCNKEKITYICNYPNEKYGSSGLCVGAEDGNFYLYSSQDAQYQFESTIKEVTAGSYADGEWTSNGKIEVKDNTFDVKAGLAYRVVIG
ncbi:MAG: DUF4978 domain-containing protein [Clostridia bacterium]|nr:DUF4978 domain-containing protein [Clostridia bacterium]